MLTETSAAPPNIIVRRAPRRPKGPNTFCSTARSHISRLDLIALLVFSGKGHQPDSYSRRSGLEAWVVAEAEAFLAGVGIGLALGAAAAAAAGRASAPWQNPSLCSVWLSNCMHTWWTIAGAIVPLGPSTQYNMMRLPQMDACCQPQACLQSLRMFVCKPGALAGEDSAVRPPRSDMQGGAPAAQTLRQVIPLPGHKFGSGCAAFILMLPQADIMPARRLHSMHDVFVASGKSVDRSSLAANLHAMQPAKV